MQTSINIMSLLNRRSHLLSLPFENMDMTKLFGSMTTATTKLEISWNNGDMDNAMTFTIPIANNDVMNYDEYDVFVICGEPVNGGMDAVDPVWVHFYDLLINPEVTHISMSPIA